MAFESSVQAMKGCWRSSVAVGLCVGSRTRHLARKSLNSLDQRDGQSSLGGSDFWILSRTRMGVRSWLGGSIWANSISVTPVYNNKSIRKRTKINKYLYNNKNDYPRTKYRLYSRMGCLERSHKRRLQVPSSKEYR